MLPFLRSDLAQLIAYTPHPGGESGSAEPIAIDHLDTNECPYDLPNDLKQKLAWQFQHELEANRYPDGAHAVLKEAIAQYVTESAQLDATEIAAANISVSNGSDELIRSILIASCIGGNGAILVAQPTFSMYAITAKTLGVPVVTIDRTPAFEMDLEAAQRAMATPPLGDSTQDPPIRAVFVVHPNSPTANALTEREIDWLLSLPPEILVVVDEAYFEFSQTSLANKLKDRSNWVILRTFSKAFRLAAQRVGYAIAHPELIAALEKVRLPYNLPSFSQTAALVTLAQRQELLKVIPTILEERSRLFFALSELLDLQVWPSDANFLFVRRKDGSSIEDVFHALKAQGTLVRSIANGLRITVGTPEENQRTIDRLTASLTPNPYFVPNSRSPASPKPGMM